MEKVVINTSGVSSQILVGKSWETVDEMLPGSGTVIITDENVFDIYGNKFPKLPVLKIKPGEESKKLEVIERLAGQLLETGTDRTGFLLAIGGGVVCDVAGFLASVYMRGIRFGYVSSSLLAQVDASTGGKNAVNLGEIKNVIGTFSQPDFVICDTKMLLTLPDMEYLSGLAELIKTGVIGDKSIFEITEQNITAVINRDPGLLSDLVTRSVRFKAKVVSEDEKESGLRRILNLGHTLGHAVEMHGSLKHGFAVAQGMKFAADFSVEKGFLGKDERDRIIGLLQRFSLLGGKPVPAERIEQYMLHDKKRSGSDIHFIFIEEIGKALIRKLPILEVIEFYRHNTTGK